jgi:hypothetical protein
VVRRKLGFKLESEKTDGERVYRVTAGKGPACESHDVISFSNATRGNVAPIFANLTSPTETGLVG